MTQNTSPFSSLRLSQNFGESLGVKKVLTTVPVGKPSKDRFFRTHTSPSWVFPTCILENKAAGEIYVVSPEVPDGHFKFPHLWPPKLLRAGRPNYRCLGWCGSGHLA